jgi:XRE family transcriptional regulator, fatty acid utilization regulator
MDTLIPAFLRRQRNQRRLTLEMLSAKVGPCRPQHLSEIESGKRDPRLSSIERMAEAMGMTVLIVPDAMAPDLRRYVANHGRIYTTHAGLMASGQMPSSRLMRRLMELRLTLKARARRSLLTPRSMARRIM